MAISLSSISKGKAAKAPRIVLLGVEKIGKSRFAASAPSPIFIPIKGEQGLDFIDAAKFPVCENYGALMECLASLCEEKHDFKTVVIDSASALEPLIWSQTCIDNGGAASIEKVGGGYGKGYVEAMKYWRDLQAALDYLRDSLDMSCILIGHVKVKGFNNPLTDPYDTYMFDVNEKAANLWYRWSDCILFANHKTFARSVAEKMNGQKTIHATAMPEPTLFCGKSPAHPAGCRQKMPDELPFNYAAFAEAYAKGG